MARRKNWPWLIARKFFFLLGHRPLRASVNRWYTNELASTVLPRPRPYSLWSHEPRPVDPEREGAVSDYTSWPALTDKSFSARHLGPRRDAIDAKLAAALPPRPRATVDPNWGPLTELWRRETFQPCQRSSVLFTFFAQWFTDSIMRIDFRDRRKNTSNHDIDLCQIYGLDSKTTELLRTHNGGELAHSLRADGEYPDRLCHPDGSVKPHYASLPWANQQAFDKLLAGFESEALERRSMFYATGLERGNSSIGYVAVSTVFLREHNRLCRLLVEHQRWDPERDDERIFQTARMINIVILMKLVVEDYINHILGEPLFLLDPSFAETKCWYRPNWIALEFNLLYRWHALVPDILKVGERTYTPHEFRNNNSLLEELTLGGVLTAASTNRAGKISLFNTPAFLLGAEYNTLKMSRDFRLDTYNAYCKQFGLAELRAFDDLTADPKVLGAISQVYERAQDIEFLVGLFAEQPDPGSLFGRLMTKMVAYDALTHIYTNPLLSKNIYSAATFTEVGLHAIESTHSIQDLVIRNLSPRPTERAVASLSYVPPAPPPNDPRI
jgi:prostaglandin-endoperoxide synthase 2